MQELLDRRQHALAFLAESRATKRMQEFLRAVVRQRIAENTNKNVGKRGFQLGSLDQLEGATGQPQLILESSYHAGEKSIHRPELKARQGPHHLRQRFRK